MIIHFPIFFVCVRLHQSLHIALSATNGVQSTYVKYSQTRHQTIHLPYAWKHSHCEWHCVGRDIGYDWLICDWGKSTVRLFVCTCFESSNAGELQGGDDVGSYLWLGGKYGNIRARWRCIVRRSAIVLAVNIARPEFVCYIRGNKWEGENISVHRIISWQGISLLQVAHVVYKYLNLNFTRKM